VPDPSTEPTANSLRLFVAIELPGEVREALSRLQHDLQRRGLEKLRWVRPEGIHLTLKFLGPTLAEKVPEIETALTDAAKGVAQHELALGELGTFGGSRPRVLWVDLRGDLSGIRDLQEHAERALNGLGYEREARGWSPHVTLARVRPEIARDLARALPGAIQGVRVPAAIIPVREVSLMRSTLRPSGAVYEQIAAFPLAAP
jgi:RNA 2',3'-cyclic 3'-phosphodiesterase